MRLCFLGLLALAACGAPAASTSAPANAVATSAPAASAPATASTFTMGPATVESAPNAPSHPSETCGGAPLAVHFLDAGQALAVLVDLPGGQHLLVDAGEDPDRPGCGAPCKEWHQRVMTELGAALAGKPLDLLWITHQHSDHLGGVPDLVGQFKPTIYVHNGTKPANPATMKAAVDAAKKSGAKIVVVDPKHVAIPELDGNVTLTAVVPPAWPVKCADSPNDCSIGLRIDYCQSSVLFTGDAEESEEKKLTVDAVTMLQVGHHGSDTSSSEGFLKLVKPKYAVISAGKENEGTNDGYCHPRETTVEHLTQIMGGAAAGKVRAFDGKVKCDKSHPSPAHWVDTPASDSLWVTARDGEVTLVTKGDGVFVRTDQ